MQNYIISFHGALLCLGCMGVAFLVALFLNPHLVKLAYSKRMLDNPNARKLQKRPVPVIGGMSVYIASVAALLAANLFAPVNDIFIAMSCITIMFYVGLLDDMLGISFKTKFFFQGLVVFILWYFGYRLDTLTGVFGINETGMIPGMLISMIAGIGLINAMNLIDGVDGLSSGIGILTSVLCGLNFMLRNDEVYAVIAFAFAGSLLPFFFCNVFSRKYKMFIGDSGSLVLGTLAYLFACRIVHQEVHYVWDNYRIAFLLAIYAVPVLDTIRVMANRIIKGQSTFHPDKTHIHHILIDLRYPHVMVTLIILMLTVACFGIWCGLSALNLSVTAVTLLVLLLGVVLVWGMYIITYIQRQRVSRLYIARVARARKTGKKARKAHHKIQLIIDGRWQLWRKERREGR